MIFSTKFYYVRALKQGRKGIGEKVSFQPS